MIQPHAHRMFKKTVSSVGKGAEQLEPIHVSENIN